MFIAISVAAATGKSDGIGNWRSSLDIARYARWSLARLDDKLAD
jgi:hypothetical protein